MNVVRKYPLYVLVAALTVGLGAWYWQFASPKSASLSSADTLSIPEFSPLAVSGKQAFDTNCAQCHGPNAAGTDKGPTLIHEIYNPGHHSDEAFFLAAKLGVRQHHWPFGNMPPQPQVTQEQLIAIVKYVREMQAANGISYRPHRM